MSNTSTEGNVVNIVTLSSLSSAFDTTNAGAHFALNSSGQITATGGSGTFDQYLRLPAIFLRENFTAAVTFVLNSLTSTSYGPGFGLRSIGTGTATPPNYHALLFGGTGSANGTAYLLFDVPPEPTSASGNLTDPFQNGTFRIAAGDSIRNTFQRAGSTITAKGENLTQGTSVSVSFTFPYPDSGQLNNAHPVPPNCTVPDTSYLTINNYGGDYTITEISVDSTSLAAPGIAYFGDSITSGYSAVSINNRSAALVAAAMGLSVRVEAGPGDRTVEVMQTLAGQTLNAATNIIALGINDNGSIPLSAYMANIGSMYGTLASRGGRVFFRIPIPNGLGIDTSAIANALNATYPGKCIDVSPGFNTGTMLSADNLHPNAAGHQHIADVDVAWLYAHPVLAAPINVTVSTQHTGGFSF